MTPAQMIEKYILLRRKVEAIKENHEAELKPFKEVMNQIETLLLSHLNETGLDSLKGQDGTAFKQTVSSVSVENWTTALDFIKNHEAWDLLEARIAKNAALTWMEDREQPIPGVKVSQAQVLRVRAGRA